MEIIHGAHLYLNSLICSSARLETSLFEEYLEVNANVPTLEWNLYWHHLFCFSMSQPLGSMQPQLCPLFSFFKGREGLYCLTNINSLRRNSWREQPLENVCERMRSNSFTTEFDLVP